MAARLGTVILAAGKGTRMHSDDPKVLRRMLGEPMLRYVLDALSSLSPGLLWTVIGHKAEAVRALFSQDETRFVEQKQQLGTGHALQTAWPDLTAEKLTHVLVVNGDTPLISAEVMRSFVDAALQGDADLAFMTLTPPAAGAFGRVLRVNGRVTAIVEAKDYDEKRHGPCPREINAGIYCLRVAAVNALLPRLSNANKSGEFYITDLVALAVAEKMAVLGIEAGDDMNLLGVNNPAELVAAEELLRSRIVREALAAGVLIHAPESVRMGPRAVVEPGAELTGPCELYGASAVRKGAIVASHCYFEDTEIKAGAAVHSFCHMVGAVVGEKCITGPFARLRPGAVLEEGAHVGSFVEVKKSRLGKGAKANHLAYIGDAEIGAGSNIGAGVITCNYDGVNKHKTVVGEGAFVGSNVSLVAPVTVGNGAYVGAGSVITKKVPDGLLGVGRARQMNIDRRKK